jgi:hypothetical protein
MNTPDLPDVENTTYLRGALVGGGVAALVLIGIGLIVGLASGADARQLLDSALPTVRFLASSVVTAAATTLALLLTLLSLSGGIEAELEPSFYRRLRRIARLDVIAFVVGILLLVALVIPLGEENRISGTAYTVAYYAFSVGSAIAAGLLVSVVLALYGAIDDLIDTLWLDGGSPLAQQDDTEG